jgi:Flp pilus assembly protein TadG
MQRGMMRVRLGRYRDRESGAALVEFAILMPLLLLLIFGIWTVARAWNVKTTMDHGVREAARYGATDPDSTAMLNVAQGELAASSIDWNDIAVKCASRVSGASLGSSGCITDNALDPTTDDRVQVVLEWQNYSLEFLFFDIDVNLTARAVGRVEPGVPGP